MALNRIADTAAVIFLAATAVGQVQRADGAPTAAQLAETPIVMAISAKSAPAEVRELMVMVRDVEFLRKRGQELGFEVRHFPGVGAVLEIGDPMKLNKLRARASMMERYAELMKSGKDPILVKDFPAEERAELEAVMRFQVDPAVMMPADISNAPVVIRAVTMMRVAADGKDYTVLLDASKGPPPSSQSVPTVERPKAPDGSDLRFPSSGINNLNHLEIEFPPAAPSAKQQTALLTKYLEETHRVTEEQEQKFYHALGQMARQHELVTPSVNTPVGSLDAATQAVIREWVLKGHPPEDVDAFMGRAVVARSAARAFITVRYRRPDRTTSSSTGPIYP